MSGFAEYDQYDGLGLAELVKKGEVHPKELVEEAIQRIEQLNPQINAVIHPLFEEARRAADGHLPDGPFRGVPFLLKDLIMLLEGVPMRSGCRFFNNYVPDHDSELVRRYKSAGVIIVGKTNTPEFGLTVVTEPELFGPTRNPWDLTRTSGGSSGGSAAAVAAGMVPVAHGNDGGGSIRIPASCCGLFGLKPTRGRTPIGPDYGEFWYGLACDHVLTRSVRDSAAMLDATAGPDTGAPYFAPPPPEPYSKAMQKPPENLRIAVTTQPFLHATVHPDCETAVRETAGLLNDLGHHVEEDAPQVDADAFSRAFLTLVSSEVRTDIREAEQLLGRKATWKDFEVPTWVLSLLGKKIPSEELSAAVRYLRRFSRQIGAFFEKYDILVTPTLSRAPVRIRELHPDTQLPAAARILMKTLARLNAAGLLKAMGGIDEIAKGLFDFIPWTPIFNVTGQPAMSVPLHWNNEGLPIGIHFIGRYADETTLFRLAKQLEEAKPWFHRRPPILSRRQQAREEQAVS